ncbi:MAG: AI-2E family transporter [Caldilineaceae bacterium]|nr:AI-2E family transporter [Caldilineaceae bacterium]
MIDSNARRDDDGSDAAGESLNPVAKEAQPEQAEQAQSVTVTSARPLAEDVLGDVPASSRWDRATKRTVVVLLIIVGGVMLWLIQPVLPILIFAGIIAYLLSPIVDFFDRLRIPRSLSTVLLFTLLLVAFILLPVLLIPVLLNQLSSLANYNPQQITRDVITWLSNSLDNLPDVITFPMLGLEFPIGNSLQELQANFQQYLVIPTLAELLNYMQQVIGTTTTVVSSTAVIGISVVGGIVQFLFTFLVIFFMSLYLTKDAPKIRSYVQGLFPPSYQPEFGELLRRISRIWQAFFRGQILLCLIIGVSTWLSLELAGMPGALILGAVAGALEIVPNLGPTLAMIPAVIVALIQGSDVLGPMGIDNVSFALITVGIYFLIQQLENNIIVPRVIGDSVNLHPIIVICGVVVGFSVGGVLGAFLAAPVIASMRVIGGYIHAKLLDYPPFQGRIGAEKPRIRSYRRTLKGEEIRRMLPTTNPTPQPSTERAPEEDSPPSTAPAST